MSATSCLIVDIRIENDEWSQASPDIDTVVTSALEAAAERMKKSGSVEVLLTDDAKMQELNGRWRSKDKPTDVLSFPSDMPDILGGQSFLGDLALGLGVIKRDASEIGRPFDLHITHLLVHGFLHLLGLDHIQPDDAKTMEGLEADILASFGLPDPYGDAA